MEFGPLTEKKENRANIITYFIESINQVYIQQKITELTELPNLKLTE